MSDLLRELLNLMDSMELVPQSKSTISHVLQNLEQNGREIDRTTIENIFNMVNAIKGVCEVQNNMIGELLVTLKELLSPSSPEESNGTEEVENNENEFDNNAANTAAEETLAQVPAEKAKQKVDETSNDEPRTLRSTKRRLNKIDIGADGRIASKKRRQSLDTNQPPNDAEFVADATPSTSNSNQTERLRAAIAKRHSKLRKTISGAEELEMLKVNAKMLKNTDYNIYCTNDFYKKLCLLFTEKPQYLATHYAKKHPDREVFISRPSPKMVNLIKLQKLDTFEYVERSKKITGKCYFCEEDKSFDKTGLEKHLITHTGEQMYFCSGCSTKGSKNGKNSGCESVYEKIYEMEESEENDSGDQEPAQPKAQSKYPLRCYICKHCNYTQINHIQLRNHLRTQHDMDIDDLSNEYESYVLVPNLWK